MLENTCQVPSKYSLTHSPDVAVYLWRNNKIVICDNCAIMWNKKFPKEQLKRID